MTKKYAIIIPDGAADEPQEGLSGRTPLQAADTPNMDRASAEGRLGLTVNTPEALPAGSDVATMSLLGYDPLEYYTGRAPLEAAAMGVALGPNDWAVRCNLVSVGEGRMVDYSAGHIRTEEAKILVDLLQAEYGVRKVAFVAGVSYRHLMIYRGGAEPAPFGPDLRTTPPHDIMDEPISEHLPTGTGAELLRELMLGSRTLLERHEVNAVRIDLGENAGNMIWLWGEGQRPTMPPFKEKYGVGGAIVSAVDLTRGVGALVGWQHIDVPTATGYLDTDYAAKGRAAIAGLREHDLVCVHVEAPDEASHEGNCRAKIEALEEIDRHVVGPVMEALQRDHEWGRLLVSPDHPTLLATRTHAHGAVPFAIWGSGVPSVASYPYTETHAARAGLLVEHGHELMEFFLKA